MFTLLSKLPSQSEQQQQATAQDTERGDDDFVGLDQALTQAFKFCAGWALFYGAWFNFGPPMSSLFLETTGLQMGGGLLSVPTLVGVAAGSLGPLAWINLFLRFSSLIT